MTVVYATNNMSREVHHSSSIIMIDVNGGGLVDLLGLVDNVGLN